MTYAQALTPNPNIPCKPGWCLQYVRQAYGLPGVHPTATAGWNASGTKHQDRSFPAGCWVPVWFSLTNEPAGHVALLAPDGSVYSTSDLTTTPHHHPDLDDLIRYYAYYGMPLGYLGWTEDIEDTAVITGAGISVEGAIISTQEEDMSLTEAQAKQLEYLTSSLFKVHMWAGATQEEKDARAAFHKEALNQGVDWYGYDGNIPSEGRRTTSQAIDLGFADTRAMGQTSLIAGLYNVIKQLSENHGLEVDLAAVQAASAAGVRDAIASVSATVTLK